METFQLDYEYDFNDEYDNLTIELVMLATRSPATLAVNKRTGTSLYLHLNNLSLQNLKGTSRKLTQ